MGSQSSTRDRSREGGSTAAARSTAWRRGARRATIRRGAARMSRTHLDPEPRPGLHVRPGLVVPESELVVRYSRSGGPGGQNVNKVATRVELEFDVAASAV